MAEFIYSKDNNTLTAEQLDSYNKNGYILFRKLIDDDLVEEINQRITDLCNGQADSKSADVVKDRHLKKKGLEGEQAVFKIQDVLYDDVFYKYSSNKAITDIVSSVIGPDLTSLHGIMFNKPPGAIPGFSLHPMHQDLIYFNFRPLEKVMAAWTALEKVDESNGCLYVLPGTHNLGLLQHGYIGDVKNLLYHGVDGYHDVPRITLEMEKGDTVFIHPLVLHGSGPNLSNGYRKAITCHYTNSNNHFIEVKGTLHENIANEILTALASRWTAGLTFTEYWQRKSRVVKGLPGNFQKHFISGHL